MPGTALLSDSTNDIDAELESALEALDPLSDPGTFEGSRHALPESSQSDITLWHALYSGDEQQQSEVSNSACPHLGAQTSAAWRPRSSRNASSAALDAYCAALQLRESRLDPGKPSEDAGGDTPRFLHTGLTSQPFASGKAPAVGAPDATADPAAPPAVVAGLLAPSPHSPAISDQGSAPSLPRKGNMLTFDSVPVSNHPAAAAAMAGTGAVAAAAARPAESLAMVTAARP